VNPQLSVFQDFHIHGASAPEWSQRYLQMSPGVMRSTLHEWSAGPVHVFRKWISERVVQQGGLPGGQLCFALLGNDAVTGMRVQGREFDADHLFILRGGQDFEMQRPAGVELLSVTFSADAFSEFLDASPAAGDVRRALAATVIRPVAAALDALRLRVRVQGAARPAEASADLMRIVRDVLSGGATQPRQRAASVAAAAMVEDCQRAAAIADREQPLRVEELCSRVRTSRRTLQDSFRQVTGASPVMYLRNLRLNAVRRRLMTTRPADLSVSHAALEAGFDHLGRFAGSYKLLFGESPSRTTRLG
jgi:AraC family ethanolamine operon transcriptional activator